MSRGGKGRGAAERDAVPDPPKSKLLRVREDLSSMLKKHGVNLVSDRPS